jgi:hypothetical protein
MLENIPFLDCFYILTDHREGLIENYGYAPVSAMKILCGQKYLEH